MCVSVSVCAVLHPSHRIKIVLGISVSEFSLNLVISGKSLSFVGGQFPHVRSDGITPKFPHLQTASVQNTVIRNNGVAMHLRSLCCNITSIATTTDFYYKSDELVGPHAS